MKKLNRLTVVAVLSVLVAASLVVPAVRADQYDAQIRELQGANQEAYNARNALQEQANSYQDAINKLQAQIAGIQAQINANVAEQNRLNAEIIAKQAELDQQKLLLADGIKAMYVDGQMSTIEMLATSRNLSEYVDKEEYRNQVQQAIQDTMAKITRLQSDLKLQKAQVDQMVDDQRAQEAQLAADRAQQASMLAYTEAQKSQYTAQIKANTNQIKNLQDQQRIANSRYDIGVPGAGANCGGGYPGSAQSRWGTWGCNYSIDNTVDNWGMYNRQCVSYTAFKVHQDYLAGRNNRDMPYWGGVGNANQWDDNARNAGIPVDGNPVPGSIAVNNSGYYGHVMYVEHVYGDGTILVSQYNANWDGRYNEVRKQTTGLVFIHF